MNVPNGISLANPFVINGSGATLSGAISSSGANATVTGTVNLGTAGTNARLGALAGDTLTVTGPIVNGTTGVNLDVSGIVGTQGVASTFGTTVLKGVSTYTGATTVIRGNLVVDGSNLTAGQANITAGAFSVGTSASGGDVGTATVQNNGVVNLNGLVQIGAASVNATGTLTVNSGVFGTTGNFQVATFNGATGSVFVNGGTLSALDYTAGNDAAGTVTPTTSTFNQTGGTVNARYFSMGFSGFGNNATSLLGGTLNVRSSAAYTAGEFEVGVFDQQTTVTTIGAGETVNLDNGANFVVGSQNNTVANTLNQNAGSTITMFGDTGATVGGAGLLIIGRGGSGTKTYNLNGGTLTVNGVTHPGANTTAVFNYNGGTLVAASNNTAFMTGLTTANVQAGGAIINSNGFNVSVGQALLNGGGTDGGLSKLGGGTLTLTGVNTYNGGTTVSAGTVRANSPATALGTGTTTVAAAGTLGGNGSTAGPSSSTAPSPAAARPPPPAP